MLLLETSEINKVERENAVGVRDTVTTLGAKRQRQIEGAKKYRQIETANRIVRYLSQLTESVRVKDIDAFSREQKCREGKQLLDQKIMH